MKLFTFSGISASLAGTNSGSGMIELANDVCAALPAAQRPVYAGLKDKDHFPSYINYGSMLGEVLGAVQLDGSAVLNAEAAEYAPRYADALSEAVAADPAEEVIVLAHSQGTNNLTFALTHLASTKPQFFERRVVRCALLDPKVGRNFMEQLIVLLPPEKLSLLFFQSELDVLGDQGLLAPKFLVEFPHGNHIWVKGLDHGSIREWASLKKAQYWLDLFGYLAYQRDYRKKVIALKQETRGGQLGTVQLLALDRWKAQYAREDMNRDKLSEALLGFLTGKLPEKYVSKER